MVFRNDGGRTLQDAALALLALVVVAGVFQVLRQNGGSPAASSLQTIVSPSSSPSPSASPDQPFALVRPATGPTRLLFVGDALTASAGFRPHTIAALEATGPVEPVEAAKPGARVADAGSLLPAPTDVALAVIELGTSDVGSTPVEAFRKDYAALLDRIRAAAPRSAIACVGVWSDTGATYDAAIKSECAAHAGIFVPLSDFFANPTLHATKGSSTFAGPVNADYPNDLGHQRIAERLLRALG